LPVPWLESPTALLPIWMFQQDGVTPYEGDPRQALARVVERYRARGLTPVVATELEFYLIDDKGNAPRVPPSPRSGKRRHQAEILALRQLDAWDQFFTRLYDACEAMDIPSDTTISEAGPGQFEINLMHQEDALKAADDTWFFKLLVKGLARQFGVAGSFMAKPYPEYAGNGLHVHFSILDRDGENIFDERRPGGADRLGHAIAGCLAAMPGSMLVFAPHSTSYDRLVPGAHAPTRMAWAHENRTAALRIPSGGPASRRIEHRVAGGDINPYLLLAAILGAALNGLEDEGAAAAHHRQRLFSGPARDARHLGQGHRGLRVEPRDRADLHADAARELPRHQAAGTALHGELSEEERTDLYLDAV
jgi:glutamine synthetase